MLQAEAAARVAASSDDLVEEIVEDVEDSYGDDSFTADGDDSIQESPSMKSGTSGSATKTKPVAAPGAFARQLSCVHGPDLICLALCQARAQAARTLWKTSACRLTALGLTSALPTRLDGKQRRVTTTILFRLTISVPV